MRQPCQDSALALPRVSCCTLQSSETHDWDEGRSFSLAGRNKKGPGL